MQELSAPEFASRPAVGALVDRLPSSWAPFVEKVFDREVTWALEKALSGTISRQQVFIPSFEYAFGALATGGGAEARPGRLTPAQGDRTTC